MAKFEVTITKISDEGERQEIGRLLLSEEMLTPILGGYTYQIDEGSHPQVPAALRCRGKVQDYHRRQSVWALVHTAVGQAIRKRLAQ